MKPIRTRPALCAALLIAVAWPGLTTTVDAANYVRGPLDSVEFYATDESGSLTDVVSFEDPTVPAPGDALYYLFRLGGDCSAASWQSAEGAEPNRDDSLP